MSETRRMAIYGIHPPCAHRSRLEERRTKARNLRLEKARKTEKPEDFVCYDDSDDEEESLCSQKKVLNSSYNFVDYVRSREQGLKEYRTCKREYSTRHILTHDMFKERSVSLNTMNKVFCSQWLSDRQVVFGTKCNKLMVYDVVRDKLDQIPSLRGRTEPSAEAGLGGEQSGIHALQINPSRTLLATGAHSSNEVAFYRLPTLDPVCIGEGAHRDWVFDMVWMDDQFLVTGSRDTRLALWRVRSEGGSESVSCDSGRDGAVGGEKALLPTYSHISALEVRECKAAQKIRALAFNQHNRELAALSLNGYIHLWNAETFKQKLSRKLPSCQENVCMAVEETGKLYAIGCRSHTLLLDPRTLQATKKIQSRFSGCGIRSTSFQGNILTIGTGVGLILFYDLRAGKYLESSINASRTAVLKTSRGYVVPDEEFMDGMNALTKYTPAIYTHCYDFSGTRLFSAGGPLPASVYGNYAGIWH